MIRSVAGLIVNLTDSELDYLWNTYASDRRARYICLQFFLAFTLRTVMGRLRASRVKEWIC